MAKLLSIYEKHEDNRLETFKEAIDAIIIYETSYEMNNKYDANSFAKIAKGIDVEKQREQFKRKLNLLKLQDMPDFKVVKVSTESEPSPTKKP